MKTEEHITNWLEAAKKHHKTLVDKDDIVFSFGIIKALQWVLDKEERIYESKVN